MRSRFNLLRKTLSWSWADIDRITGRRHSGSNITKGVPNWARLAIVAHERYQRQLQLHLIDAVRLRLGFEWALVRRGEAGCEFVPPYPIGAAIRITFAPGEFVLSANTDNFAELCAQLRLLYPAEDKPTVEDGFQRLTFRLAPPAETEEVGVEYFAEYGLPV